MQRNLVLGLAANYDIPTLRPFVRSFQKHTRCDILLFTQNLGCETLAWLHAEGVQTLSLEGGEFPPHNTRFFACRKYLRDATCRYDRILLTDVRDVIAQGDLFQELRDTPPGVHVFQEAPDKDIGRCQWNAAWIKECYGNEVLAALAFCPIVCVGTVCGNRAALAAYLDRLCGELLQPAPSGMPRAYTYGADTAAHIYLIYSGKLHEALAEQSCALHIHDNNGPIFTMGNIKQVSLVKEKTICNAVQGIPAVVHQYDRCPELAERIAAYYAPPE